MITLVLGASEGLSTRDSAGRRAPPAPLFAAPQVPRGLGGALQGSAAGHEASAALGAAAALRKEAAPSRVSAAPRIPATAPARAAKGLTS